MLQNAFNTPRLCMLTGDIKPLGQLKATPRETQLFASNAAKREKIVMAESANQIHITTQVESDESRRKAGRHLRG
jgi:hypothetical protein